MSDLRNTRSSGKDDAGLGVMDMSAKEEGQGFNMDDWWEERTLPEKILAGIGFGILGIGLLALFGLAVMLLWNWLMPEIFGLKRLDYWQAWGLLALCWILFKNWSFNDNGDSSNRRRKRQLRRYMREEHNLAGNDSLNSPEA
jgi:hypothetical protein